MVSSTIRFPCSAPELQGWGQIAREEVVLYAVGISMAGIYTSERKLTTTDRPREVEMNIAIALLHSWHDHRVIVMKPCFSWNQTHLVLRGERLFPSRPGSQEVRPGVVRVETIQCNLQKKRKWCKEFTLNWLIMNHCTGTLGQSKLLCSGYLCTLCRWSGNLVTSLFLNAWKGS